MSRASPTSSLRARESAFTLVEVMVAAGLIVLVLVGIYTMQAQAMQLLRGSRNANSSSQMMQQRVEQLRATTYADATSSAAVLAMLQGAAGATQAERDMIGVSNLVETITISPYFRPGATLPPTIPSFTINRSAHAATGPGGAISLAAHPQVKARLRVTWNDRGGSHRREFSTILSKGGLSAEGISEKP